MKLVHFGVLSTAFAISSTIAVAQNQPQGKPQTTVPAPTNNANEVICEREAVTGSRLAHRKVCMTRSQWEESRREDRKAVEKAQSERGLIGEPPGE